MAIFISLYIIALILSSIPVSFQQDQFIFNGFSGPSTNITLNGSAEFLGNGSIQLTNYNTELIGQAFYNFPIRFKNSTNGSASSFSTCFAFSISHVGRSNGTSGDGMAFFIARSTNFSYGHAGSQFGIFSANGDVSNNSNLLVAVEFDTYQNDPFQDIDDNHVGIDINNLFSTASEPAGYFGNDARRNNITLRGGQPIMTWIEYDSITNFLNITLSLTSMRPSRPLISLQRDLSPDLEQGMYVGFSASTGGGPNSAQNLLGWSFNLNGEAEPLNLSYFSSIPLSLQQDQFIFNGFSSPNTNITLNGSAEFHGNGSIQLTNYNMQLIGQAFYNFPIRFKNSNDGPASSFSTSFAFSISHTGSPHSTSGDGLAFFIAQSTNFSYAHWGSQLGLFNASGEVDNNLENRLLAVEFDTYQNDPFQDINDNHVGIDINSLFSQVSEPAAYFDDHSRRRNITLRGGQPIMAWIEYDSVTNFLNVTLSLTSTKPRMPLVSLQRDLSSILVESMYVGFSASTGGGPNYAQNILGWSFRMNGEAEPLNLSDFPPSFHLGKERNNRTALVVGISVGAFFLVLIIAVIVFFLTRKSKNDAKVTKSGEFEIGPEGNKYLKK